MKKGRKLLKKSKKGVYQKRNKAKNETCILVKSRRKKRKKRIRDKVIKTKL